MLDHMICEARDSPLPHRMKVKSMEVISMSGSSFSNPSPAMFDHVNCGVAGLAISRRRAEMGLLAHERRTRARHPCDVSAEK